MDEKRIVIITVGEALEGKTGALLVESRLQDLNLAALQLGIEGVLTVKQQGKIDQLEAELRTGSAAELLGEAYDQALQSFWLSLGLG